MTRIHSALALLPVVAVLSACGSSATAPGGGTGTPTTTYYIGDFASAVATGTFKATVTTTASGEVLAASTLRTGLGATGSIGTLQSGNSITIAVTFLNATMLTLTGPLNGTTFTISDNNTPQDVCTGSILNLLAATCTFLGQPNIQLSGALATLDQIGVLTTYCGAETPVAGGPSPGGTLLLGIAGSNSFLARVAPPNNTVSFYRDNAAAATVVADTLVGPTGADVVTDFFGGTFSSSTASGTHTISGSLAGNWTANSPCVLYTEGLSSGGETPPYMANVVFTAPVNTTPATQNVLVSPVGIGAITAALKTAASWLTVTVSGSNVVLSAAPQAAVTANPSPDTVKVYVWAQFAKNAPDSILVTYNVTGGPAPVLSGNNNTLTFTMTQSAAPPAAQLDQISATGGTVPLTQPPTVSYGAAPAPQNWLNVTIPASVSPGTPVELSVTPTAAVSGFAVGQYTANIEVTSSTPGVAPVMVGVGLHVTATGACTIAAPSTLTVYQGTLAYVPIGFTGTGCPAPFSYIWNVINGSLPSGLEIEPDIDAIQGTATTSGQSGMFTLQAGPLTSSPISYTVLAAQGCVIGPATLPGGTHGQSYGYQIAASAACTNAGDDPTKYSWSISGNAGTGLGLAAGAAHMSQNELFGTLTTAGTDVITITFTNGNTSGLGATITYTIPIS